MINIAKPLIGEEEKKAVLEVLDSGVIVSGKKVKEFEEKFAQFCGVKHAIAINNGTAALHASLYAIGIRPGDEVITSPFTFVATANCILMMGAKPVFADVEEDTFNLDPESVKQKITPRTKAILPVDLYGHIYNYSAIKNIAEEHHLFIVEDACQAVNAELNGIKAGNFGDIAAFSFYATKNITTGEGGMITTNNDQYAEMARRFRHHGQSEQTRYEYHDLGYNYRMTDLQAAIGLEQLRKVEGFTQKRIENAQHLTNGLKNVPGIKLPVCKTEARHVYHQYTIKVDSSKRDLLNANLKEKGINCGVYYPKPLHLFPCFSKLGYRKSDFPVAEKLSHQVLSLPVHPALTKEELDHIIASIHEFKCELPVVVLCGGKGTRMWPLTAETPKSLIEIGGKAVLWHLMKKYSAHGHKEFILCLGYLADKIKDYFSKPENRDPDWKIHFVDTGLDVTKSQRMEKIKEYISGEQFLLCYSDDLSNIDINEVISFHQKNGKAVTLTSIPLYTNFGVLELADEHEVRSFREKPRIPEYWINGGFFVCDKKVFEHLHRGEFEDEVLKYLASQKQVAAFKFDGFWKCMNSSKEAIEFNHMYDKGDVPWKNW